MTMRFCRLLAPLLFAVSALLPVSRLAADPADIAAAARSVVRVVLIASDGERIGLIGHGSGVAIAPDLVLTNAHVVAAVAQDDSIRVGVVPPEGSGTFARIVAVSPGNDLALIRLEQGSVPPATLFTGGVEDGSAVHAVGYPGNVDQAQGLDIADLMDPTPPVKTQGTVSSGRSSKAFDTILHTASIGAGNSGGPLVDGCGRVIGINSFGALSGEGDSEFYFAISMREISRFLQKAGVRAATTGSACRSLAEVERADAERRAGEDARAAAAARDIATRQAMTTEQARRTAQFAVMAERDNRAALAMLALILALGAGGAALRMRDRDRLREGRVLSVAAGGLVLAGLLAWLSRPPFSAIDERAGQLVSAPGAEAEGGGKKSPLSGELVCVLDPVRSRLTVSDGADLTLRWTEGGCRDRVTQFGRTGNDWIRIAPSERDHAVSVLRFDPVAGIWTSERFLLGLQDFRRLKSGEGQLRKPLCQGPDHSIREFGDESVRLAATLPGSPTERLVYRCQARK